MHLQKIYVAVARRYSRTYGISPFSPHGQSKRLMRSRFAGFAAAWARSEASMSGNLLRQPLRKKAGRTPKPLRAARPLPRIARQSMIERRDHCMTEIARLRSDANAADNLLHKARQLLTRYWSASSWRSRADILRTAEWLVGIGSKGAGHSGAGDAGPVPYARERARNVESID
jgi:hypothetical protein